MNKRHFITTTASLAAIGLLGAGCTTTGGASGDPAARRQAIDSAADSALSRLYKEAAGSQEMVAAAQGVLLPLAAVTRTPGKPDGGTVWVVGEDGRVRPVGVGILAWREDGALLRADLPAGARLVVAGVHTLVEGETVRAVEEGAPVLLDVKR